MIKKIVIKLLGYSKINFIGMKKHKGNRFVIKVSNIQKKDARTMEQSLRNIKEKMLNGLPNYYGFQRFGLQQNNHIIGREIIKGNYNNAIKLFLYNSKSPKKNIINNKENIAYKRKILKILNQKNSNMENALKSLPVFNFFLSSYQSYLFNKAITQYFKEFGYKNISFPVLGTKKIKDKFIIKIYRSLLSKDKISLNQFQKGKSSIYLRNYSRRTIYKSKNFSYEINNRNELYLKFELGIGHYAGLILDFIFDNEYVKLD